MSGAASVALGIHGPNFGVGGGPNAVPELFVTALSLLTENRVPGIWLILAEFDPEPLPDRAGAALNAVTAHGVALAVQANSDSGRLRLVRSPTMASSGTVRDLANFLSNRSPDRHRWLCGLAGLGSIELALAEGQQANHVTQ